MISHSQPLIFDLQKIEAFFDSFRSTASIQSNIQPPPPPPPSSSSSLPSLNLPSSSSTSSYPASTSLKPSFHSPSYLHSLLSLLRFALSQLDQIITQRLDVSTVLQEIDSNSEPYCMASHRGAYAARSYETLSNYVPFEELDALQKQNVLTKLQNPSWFHVSTFTI